jgi:hypothetical protein
MMGILFILKDRDHKSFNTGKRNNKNFIEGK